MALGAHMRPYSYMYCAPHGTGCYKRGEQTRIREKREERKKKKKKNKITGMDTCLGLYGTMSMCM